MNVSELIAALKKLPQDAEVFHVWDGAARTCISHVWLAKGGFVATADYGQVVYNDEDRPESAPLQSDDLYWGTDNL